MTIKRLQPLIKAIPIVLGASLITTIPVRASEQPDNQAQSSGSNPTVAEGIRFADPHARHSIIPSVDESDLVITGAFRLDVCWRYLFIRGLSSVKYWLF